MRSRPRIARGARTFARLSCALHAVSVAVLMLRLARSQCVQADPPSQGHSAPVPRVHCRYGRIDGGSAPFDARHGMDHANRTSVMGCAGRTQVWRRLRGTLVSMVMVLAASGCVTEPSAITGETRSFAYTWEQELELGAEADREIVSEMGVYEDPELQAYVDEVAQRVLAHSDFSDPDAPELYRDTSFTFRVLDSPVVNAFALPGGYVYVTRGLLAHLNNEAQLAVVLGHEIGHVVARHASRQALRSQLGQLGLIAGAILGEQVAPESNLGSQILELGGTAFQLLLFRYSRDAEREADELGIEYASRGGYAAEESAGFFRSLERMADAGGRALPAWQSTHPDPGERAGTVRELSLALRPVGEGEPVIGTDAFLDRIDGIVLGDDPRQGFREGDVFYHPGLAFQFLVPRVAAAERARDGGDAGAQRSGPARTPARPRERCACRCDGGCARGGLAGAAIAGVDP